MIRAILMIHRLLLNTPHRQKLHESCQKGYTRFHAVAQMPHCDAFDSRWVRDFSTPGTTRPATASLRICTAGSGAGSGPDPATVASAG